jgi:hypothetical protein
LSLTSRVAPTGTSTARSASSPACSIGVFGWVEVDVARVVRREVVDRRVPVLRFAGLFRAVERLVLDLLVVG